jgi:O-antigen/teichoic acid export membrane protein
MKRHLFGAFGISVAQLALGLILNMALPPLMLRAWGDAGYALWVGIQGFTLFLALADAGLQGFLTQRVAVLYAEGRAPDVRALASTGLRAMVVLCLIGAVLLLAAFWILGGAVHGSLATEALVPRGGVIIMTVMLIISGGVGLALGGWSTALEAGMGNVVRVQALGFCRTLASTGGMVLMTSLSASPLVTVPIVSSMLVLFDAWRFASVLARVLKLPSGVNHSPVLVRMAFSLFWRRSPAR